MRGGCGGGRWRIDPRFFRSFQGWQFPLVSYLRWTFPAKRLRKMFLQNIDPRFFRSFQGWQFPLVSYLRWTFPAKRLRKMFLQNTPWMPIRTLRYIITPEGQSWRRFLATQFTLIFEVEVFLWSLSWKVWNTCEVRRKQRNS